MSFTGVWKPRSGCCADFPVVPRSNVTTLIVDGFNYRTVPVFYSVGGKRIEPTNYSSHHHLLRSIFTLSGEHKTFYIVTSDNIQPTITEWSTGKKADVSYLTHTNGYEVWSVSL